MVKVNFFVTCTCVFCMSSCSDSCWYSLTCRIIMMEFVQAILVGNKHFSGFHRAWIHDFNFVKKALVK